MALPSKADGDDFTGRFREVLSDPLNLLIARTPLAGIVEDGLVYLHNGLRVPIEGKHAYYGAFSQILVLNRGVHEPLEEFVFQELLKSIGAAPIMLELGAYWGHYSLWLKKLRPAARVILVEPDSQNLQVGMNNFKVNGLEGEFIPGAVSKTDLQLDAMLALDEISHLDILHADIQGAEGELLDGAVKTLTEKRVDYLFVSTHSQALHELVASRLDQFGYRIEVSSDFDDGTTACDGLVFASSPNAKKLFDQFTPLGRTEINSSSPADLLRSISTIR